MMKVRKERESSVLVPLSNPFSCGPVMRSRRRHTCIRTSFRVYGSARDGVKGWGQGGGVKGVGSRGGVKGVGSKEWGQDGVG